MLKSEFRFKNLSYTLACEIIFVSRRKMKKISAATKLHLIKSVFSFPFREIQNEMNGTRLGQKCWFNKIIDNKKTGIAFSLEGESV